jgi:heme exporter protein C
MNFTSILALLCIAISPLIIAPVGAALTFLALVTGAIWGKPTWGAYWIWQDARLTSMLLLFFLYLGIMALHDAYQNSTTGNRAAAIMSLVGTVNIPIIYKSVDWWSSLHQPATLKFTEESTIATEMLQPLMLAIPGAYLFFIAAVMLQLRVLIARNEKNTRWMADRAAQ